MLEHRLEATIPLCWSTGWTRCPLLLQHKLELACPAAGSTREGGCRHQCCWIGGGGQQLLLHSIPQICHTPCLPRTLPLSVSHSISPMLPLWLSPARISCCFPPHPTFRHKWFPAIRTLKRQFWDATPKRWTRYTCQTSPWALHHPRPLQHVDYALITMLMKHNCHSQGILSSTE
jgi:hypothetical protein